MTMTLNEKKADKMALYINVEICYDLVKCGRRALENNLDENFISLNV